MYKVNSMYASTCAVGLALMCLAGCQGLPVEVALTQTIPDYEIRPLIGVNAGPELADASGDLTAEYMDVGVTMVRTHDCDDVLSMSEMYPDFDADPTDPGNYDFTASDTTFDAIVAAGAEPYLRIGESYDAAGAQVPTRAQFNNWAQAAVYIVGHYLARSPFRYVEVGNEHNNEDFWPRDTSGTDAEVRAEMDRVKEEFHELFVLTVSALRSAYPNLQIGGPGFSPVVAASAGNHWLVDFIVYLRDYRDTVDSSFRIDFLSWHLYAHDPNRYQWTCYYYLDYIADLYMTDVESHLTEWNVEHDVTAGGGGGAIAKTRNTGEGAANLTASWIVLHRFVDQAHFYRGIDKRAPDDPDNPMGYGLFTVDGTYKAIAHAFALWAELLQYSAQRYETSATLAGAVDYGTRWGFYSIAGENASGGLAVLLANIGAFDVEWTIRRPDGTLASASSMLVKEVDVDGNYREYAPLASANVIPRHTTQLVLIGP